MDLFCEVEILMLASKRQSLLVSFLLGWTSSQSSTRSNFLYTGRRFDIVHKFVLIYIE